MRKTLAFLVMFFAAYWLWSSDSTRDGQAAFDPVVPGLTKYFPRVSELKSDSKTSSDLTGIHHWLLQETMKVSHAETPPTATVVRLKQKALSLQPAEIRILKDTALSPTSGADERFLAVYIIGLAESASARDFLKEIAQTPIPATANDRAYSDELVIRANALESVVHRLSRAESTRYLEDVLAHTTDAALAKHMRYWLTRLD